MMSAKYPDLDTGWAWVVLIAAFVTLLVCGGTNYSSGLIHAALIDSYHESHSATSWAGALHTSLFNIAAPLSGIVVDKFSLRTAILSGGLLMTLGYLTSAYASSLKVVIFTCGIISGIGGALVWTASMVSTGFYFDRYRNLAFGFSVAGVALGIFTIPPAIQAGKQYYGITGFFVTLACIALQLVVCAVIMRPSSLELHTQMKKRRKARNENGSKLVSIKKSAIAYMKILTCRAVLCLSASMFAYCIGTYIVFQYLPNYCKQEGTLPMQTSFVISICGISSIFGRLLTGFVTNLQCVNEIYVYCLNMLLAGICIVTFPLFSHTYQGQLIFSGLFGFFFGAPYVTITPTNIKYVGISNMAIALGIELCFGGFGSIAGPVIVGFLLDDEWTFGQTFVLAGGAVIIGAVFGFLTICCNICNSSTEEQTIEHKIELEVEDPGQVLMKT